ncbi:dihydrodipicolinate synthase family protein [Paraburkholderia sp. EG285A]|uniref:dihydrodipicolinate synthase family protein n=1 Tax=Paraburkholderia sp. EG285A TaxID=3237009 RepID=UPI0034D187AC
MLQEGVFSAIVTPFTEDGESVNKEELRRLVEAGIRSGLDGFVPAGGTGEFATLSVDERKEVVETVCKQAAGRAKVIAQVGSTSTREAVALARHAESAGADAIMLATPYYESITFDQVRSYYRAVGDATSLPICIYNFPPAMGVKYSVDMVKTLAEDVPTVKLMKDSSGDFHLLNDLISAQEKVSIFCGEDILSGPAFLRGAGVIVGSTNFCAPAMAKLHKAARAADYQSFVKIWDGIVPLILAVIGGHYNGGVKAVCRELGFAVGPIRAPYGDLSGERLDLIKRAIERTDRSLLNWAD